MESTIGVIELNIARLQHQRKINKQQQRLSSPYLEYKMSLVRQDQLLRSKLNQLVRHREALRQGKSRSHNERLFNGNH